MQCNTSMVILDPKGEIVRDTGELLEKKGYKKIIRKRRHVCSMYWVYQYYKFVICLQV